jgi:signal transduction histidine kinase
MDAKEREGLFQKFYRIQGEETKGIVGTGLGLWITKQLVEQMKGKISVESIKGKGSRFFVAFKGTEKK